MATASAGAGWGPRSGDPLRDLQSKPI